MESVVIFRALIDYHYTIYNRIWESVAQLSDADFLHEIDYAHGSVRNQILHVATVDKRWLMGLKENPEARVFQTNPDDFPDVDTTKAFWDSIAEEMLDYLDALNENQLTHIPRGMSGPVWQVLAHIVNHGTDHRAQILRLLEDFGAPTFDQDLILHLWRQ